VNRTRNSKLDAAASVLLVAFGSALAATALFFVIERDAYVAGLPRALLFIGTPALLAAAAFAAAPTRRRRRFALIALLVAAGFYAGELALSYANWLKWSAVLAASDPRSKVEFLEQLRSAEHDAWPIAPPAVLAGALASQDAHSEARQLRPLGGIANVKSVFCGEGRPFVTYQSDRYGFFNPDAAYNAKPNLMLLGDSYIQGYCVGSNDGIAPRLRERIPGALNFGMSGNGPLSMLASLREYGRALEPEVVIWSFFAGNDLANLESERDQSALAAYLDPDHQQGLSDQQAEVDALLRNYIDGEQRSAPRTSIAEAEGLRATFGRKLLPIASFHNLLPFLGLPSGRIDFDYKLFEEILRAARDEVEGWSGQLLFVYLPITADLYGLSGFDVDGSYPRQRILEIVRGLEIPIVDLHAIIAALPDPMAVSNTPRSHYNEFGYELVAREIALALESYTKRSKEALSGADPAERVLDLVQPDD
jgi:hypothetical protein